jgi:hypothetical protein
VQRLMRKERRIMEAHGGKGRLRLLDCWHSVNELKARSDMRTTGTDLGRLDSPSSSIPSTASASFPFPFHVLDRPPSTLIPALATPLDAFPTIVCVYPSCPGPPLRLLRLPSLTDVASSVTGIVPPPRPSCRASGGLFLPLASSGKAPSSRRAGEAAR